MGALLGLLAGVGILLVCAGSRTQPARTRSHPWVRRRREVLAQAGLGSVPLARIFGIQAATGLAALMVAFIITGSVSISLVFAGFAGYSPWLLIQHMRRRRRADLQEVWPEVVDNLTSGVRAGLSLPEALASIGDAGPIGLREPFKNFGTDYRATGAFNECLDRLKGALADPVGDRLCESLRVAREVGGTDLGRLLGTLSRFLREDSRARSELLARQSWSVSAARMAVAAPWLVLLLLATRRETLQAYDTPAGVVIIVIGAALSILAYRLMIRIGRLPEDRRVLR